MLSFSYEGDKKFELYDAIASLSHCVIVAVDNSYIFPSLSCGWPISIVKTFVQLVHCSLHKSSKSGVFIMLLLTNEKIQLIA